MALICAVFVVAGGVTPCAGSPSLVYCAGAFVLVVCVRFCVSVVREGVCSIFGVRVLILARWGSIPQRSWWLVALVFGGPNPKALHFQPWVGLGL